MMKQEKAVLGEVLMDELKVIREYLKDLPVIKQKVTSIDERLIVVEADMKIVKAAVTDISHQQKDHDRRISRLEAA
jgi:hypothetical protein